jgi:raffinose/stachyose/melibiose transport system permease protein
MMKQKKVSLFCQYTVLAAVVLICLLPLWFVFSNSFKTHNDIVANPLSVKFTSGITNYSQAWKEAHFARTLLNSVIYTGSTIIVVLFCAVLAAYVLATGKIRGTSIILLYFMITMTIPVQLFLVPLYSLYAKLRLLGNLPAVSLILAACNLPLAISLMRVFFLNVPKELEEAAVIDGAAIRDIILRIIIPIISPGMITVAIIVGLNSWNEFLVSSTFLIGEKNFTAMLALLALNGVNNANHGLNMAATVILIGPVMIFFVLMERRFIDGIVSGAVKG